MVKDILKTLSNKIIKKTWRGYGSTIFFELENISPSEYQYKIMLGSDWRIEKNNNFIISSFFKKDKIDKFLFNFVGKKISKIKIIPEFAEIMINIEKYKILTFQLEGKADWALFDNKKKLCYSLGETGIIQVENIHL